MKKIFKKKVVEVLTEALKAKGYPAKFAAKIMSDAKRIPVKTQLLKLKFRKSDIDMIFRQIFEKVNIASTAEYFSMNTIDESFNLSLLHR